MEKANVLEYLEEILSQCNEDLWDYFDPKDYGSISESAFKDEGNQIECNLCDSIWGEADNGFNDDKALDELKEHLVEEHLMDIVLRELKTVLCSSKSDDDKQMKLYPEGSE